MEIPATKYCKPCNKEVDIGDFHKDKSKKYGVSSRCKNCSAKSDEIKRTKYKEKYIQISKDYYLNNKENVKKRIKKYKEVVGNEKTKVKTKEHEKRLFAIMGGRCIECGTKENLTIDHIYGGGTQERKTVSKQALVRRILKDPELKSKHQLLCYNCNGKKNIVNLREATKTYNLTGVLKQCDSCDLSVDTSQFHKHPSYVDGLYYECIQCTNKKRDEIKIRAMSLCGKYCLQCGEKDINKLNLDHIEPVGNNRNGHGITVYRRIVNGVLDKNKFQVLCFSCNQIKGGEAKKSEEYFLSNPREYKRDERELVDFDFKTCSIKIVDNEESAVFLDAHHYDGYGRYSKINYGVFLGEELIAIVKFCAQGRQGTARQIGHEGKDILELDRFCIHPSRHKKNFGSFVMSRVTKLVRGDFPDIKCLVSFADPAFGHVGTLYKSSNWVLVGKTSKSYYYKKPGGEVIKKKTFYNWMCVRGLNKDKTELEVAESLGIERVRVPAKFKFKYEL